MIPLTVKLLSLIQFYPLRTLIRIKLLQTANRISFFNLPFLLFI